jgi:hypothetical protein
MLECGGFYDPTYRDPKCGTHLDHRIPDLYQNRVRYKFKQNIRPAKVPVGLDTEGGSGIFKVYLDHDILIVSSYFGGQYMLIIIFEV